MSHLPPTGPPPSGPPPSGPPTQPYAGAPGYPPPPPPTQAGSEYLDSGRGGGPIPPPPGAPPSGRGRRRTGLLVGGGVLGIAALAGGAFAVYQVGFATGPQPAEALPASTVGYVSIDLDPSGKQQLEALDTLKKFPALDDLGIDSKDDLREKVFDYVQEESGACAGLDFGDDVDPWLGNRFGIAAVDVGEDVVGDETGIAPVFVVQLSDADKADDGLSKLRDTCASAGDVASGGADSGTVPSAALSDETEAEDDGSAEAFAWSITGDWAVIAETSEIAEAVTSTAEDEPLSDDEDFEKWTGEAGDAGILTAYAAPEAGDLIVDALESDLMMGGDDYATDCIDEDGNFEPCEEPSESSGDERTQALRDMFADFSGAALTVRFDDGGLEVESASSVDLAGFGEVTTTDRGDDVVSSLPDDTAIAVGVGFDQGWFTALTDYIESSGGGMIDVQEGLESIETATGLSLPEDAEALLGESAALAISGDVDFSADEPTGQPLAIKVQGDPDRAAAVLDKLLENPDVQEELDGSVTYQQDGDHLVAGLSEAWNERLLEGGDLGDTDAYQDVVRESDDASAVVYVNFDTGDWLKRAVEADGGDQEVLDNLEPLEAAGLSGWTDDDVSHSVFRITTN